MARWWMPSAFVLSVGLFFAKDCEGIDASGAEGGNQAGPEGDEDEQHGYDEEGCEVAGAYSVDHAGDDAADGESLRWRGGADGEGERTGARGFHWGSGGLRERPVESGDAGGAVEAGLLHVADDTDDLAILVGKEGELEVMADRTAVWPELFGHGLADDDDGR